MASIQVHGKASTVTLSEPDEDGDHHWSCICGAQAEDCRPIADAIAHAEIHVDIQCPLIESE